MLHVFTSICHSRHILYTECVLNEGYSTDLYFEFTFPAHSYLFSLCLDLFSLQCALGRLQLGAEVHARLSRPHLRLSISMGEKQRQGRGDRSCQRGLRLEGWSRAAVLDQRARRREEFNFTVRLLQQGSSGVGELRKRRVRLAWPSSKSPLVPSLPGYRGDSRDGGSAGWN